MNENNNYLDTLVEIKLKKDEDFLIIKETLTRMGIMSSEKQELTQTCHILHKTDRKTNQSKYYIVHFKEMFPLDDKPSTITETDIARRNSIVNYLADKGFLILVDPVKSAAPLFKRKIDILKWSPKVKQEDNIIYRKDGWKLIAKYHIGNTR